MKDLKDKEYINVSPNQLLASWLETYRTNHEEKHPTQLKHGLLLNPVHS